METETAAHAPEATVRELYAAFNRGDVDAIAALTHPDMRLEDVAAGIELTGPDALVAWLGGWLDALSGARVEPGLVFTAGERVFGEHTGRGVHTGPLRLPDGSALPPTGRPIAIRIAETFQVRDGRIAELVAYYDAASVLRQLDAA